MGLSIESKDEKFILWESSYGTWGKFHTFIMYEMVDNEANDVINESIKKEEKMLDEGLLKVPEFKSMVEWYKKQLPNKHNKEAIIKELFDAEKVYYPGLGVLFSNSEVWNSSQCKDVLNYLYEYEFLFEETEWVDHYNKLVRGLEYMSSRMLV